MSRADCVSLAWLPGRDGQVTPQSRLGACSRGWPEVGLVWSSGESGVPITLVSSWWGDPPLCGIAGDVLF